LHFAGIAGSYEKFDDLRSIETSIVRKLNNWGLLA